MKSDGPNTARYLALIDIENEASGHEYAAAMYESYQADHEWEETRTRSAADYATAADTVAGDIQAKWEREMERKFFAECRDIGWRNPYMEGH